MSLAPGVRFGQYVAAVLAVAINSASQRLRVESHTLLGTVNIDREWLMADG